MFYEVLRTLSNIFWAAFKAFPVVFNYCYAVFSQNVKKTKKQLFSETVILIWIVGGTLPVAESSEQEYDLFQLHYFFISWFYNYLNKILLKRIFMAVWQSICPMKIVFTFTISVLNSYTK